MRDTERDHGVLGTFRGVLGGQDAGRAARYLLVFATGRDEEAVDRLRHAGVGAFSASRGAAVPSRHRRVSDCVGAGESAVAAAALRATPSSGRGDGVFMRLHRLDGVDAAA